MPRNTPGYNAGGVVEIIADVDFSKINDGDGLDAAAAHPAISLPAGAKVLLVGYEIIKPSETLDDFDVGDGDDANRYLDAADGTAAAGTVDSDEAATTLSHRYSTADTIDITNSTAENCSTGIIRLSAYCIIH